MGWACRGEELGLETVFRLIKVVGWRLVCNVQKEVGEG